MHTHMCKIESKWNSCIGQGAQLELCDDLEKWDGGVEGEAQEGGDTWGCKESDTTEQLK